MRDLVLYFVSINKRLKIAGCLNIFDANFRGKWKINYVTL